MTHAMARVGRLAGLLIAGALVVAGCSSESEEDLAGDGGPTSRPADVSSSDIAFAQAMVANHQQAIEMAGLAEERSEDPRVRELADRIEAARQSESATLTAWLSNWGARSSAPAEVTAEAQAALAAASGQAFDRSFVEQMIEHYTGAINISVEAAAGGQDADAREMAENIVSTYGTQVIEMAQLRTDMGG